MIIMFLELGNSAFMSLREIAAWCPSCLPSCLLTGLHSSPSGPWAQLPESAHCFSKTLPWSFFLQQFLLCLLFHSCLLTELSTLQFSCLQGERHHHHPPWWVMLPAASEPLYSNRLAYPGPLAGLQHSTDRPSHGAPSDSCWMITSRPAILWVFVVLEVACSVSAEHMWKWDHLELWPKTVKPGLLINAHCHCPSCSLYC